MKCFSKEEKERFGLDKVYHINDFIKQSKYNTELIKKHSITLNALYNKAEKYFKKRRDIDKQSISVSENTITYLINNGYKKIERTDKWILFNLSNSNAVKVEGIRMHNCIGGYNNFDKLYSLKEIIDVNRIKDYASIEDNKQFKGICNNKINITKEILKLKTVNNIINIDEFKFKIKDIDLELIEKRQGKLKCNYFKFKDWVIFEHNFIY